MVIILDFTKSQQDLMLIMIIHCSFKNEKKVLKKRHTNPEM